MTSKYIVIGFKIKVKMSICPDRVAKLCYDFYAKNIPAKNKPVDGEWTTLAAILMITTKNEGFFLIVIITL